MSQPVQIQMLSSHKSELASWEQVKSGEKQWNWVKVTYTQTLTVLPGEGERSQAQREGALQSNLPQEMIII